jgi:hypothetical protein
VYNRASPLPRPVGFNGKQNCKDFYADFTPSPEFFMANSQGFVHNNKRYLLSSFGICFYLRLIILCFIGPLIKIISYYFYDQGNKMQIVKSNCNWRWMSRSFLVIVFLLVGTYMVETRTGSNLIHGCVNPVTALVQIQPAWEKCPLPSGASLSWQSGAPALLAESGR